MQYLINLVEMRKHFTFLLLFFFVINAYSQKSALKINENTIVKDSTGFVYPYSIWQSLMFKGKYGLMPENPSDKNTGFILYRLSEKQWLEKMQRMPKPKESLFFTTGKKISLYKLFDINNKKINLKEGKGKIIVFNFWFIDCPPCKMEIPDLNDLVENYKGNDSVLFIAVALDAEFDLKDFLKRMPFNYTIIGNGRYLASNYGVKSYPTHVILDKEGKVYLHTSGLAPNTVFWIKKSIDELLSSQLTVQNKL